MRKVQPNSIIVLLALATILLCVLAEQVLLPRTAPVTAAPVRPVQIVQGKHEPIAVYRERDRTLIVTTHAGRDLLVCFRDEQPEHCKLVEVWLER